MSLVLFGLSLLADALRKPKHKGVKVVRNGRDGLDADVKKNTFVCKDDHFVTSNSFGDANRRVVLDCLAKGQASVSFGDLELDLTGVKEFAPDCRLDLSCSFGDMDVQVPKTCRVEHTASSSFADVSIEGHPNPDAKYRIFVNCSANFGDISIEYV